MSYEYVNKWIEKISLMKREINVVQRNEKFCYCFKIAIRMN